MLVNNHWRFVCGILGIVVLGAAMVWLSRHDADAARKRLEQSGGQIGTVLPPDESSIQPR